MEHTGPGQGVAGLVPRSRKMRRLAIILATALMILGSVLFAAWVVFRDNLDLAPLGIPAENASDRDKKAAALAAGRQLSNGKCEGEGPVKLGASPMRPDDFAFIIPYGLMVDGHVTPIDHQYFSPTDFHSAPDTYPVYAMADGRITDISHRGESIGYQGRPSNDYRFVFSHTCTFLTYYDLVTSLAPDIKTEFEKAAKKNGNFSYASLDIEVKQGQLVGYIGGQTLDFAVWDTEKPLKGFVSPELYEGERWKIYTADPLDYLTDELKEIFLAKYLRTDEGKSGKIDWDIDGKLIGNWFAEGTNGYEGDRDLPDGKYWRGHLAIAPDHLDPRYHIASFGTFREAGDGEQFVISTASPDPKDVEAASGLVKYQLHSYTRTVNGQRWEQSTIAKDPQLEPTQLQGCVLLQLLETRKLRAEPFPGKPCSSVADFTNAAKTYTR